jgi:hypothetical protein
MGSVRCVDAFEDFYAQVQPKRRLRWCLAHGTAVLQMNVGSAPSDQQTAQAASCEVECSTLQAIVLLSFNAAAEQTLAQLVSATALPASALRRELLSLCSSRHRLLLTNEHVRPKHAQASACTTSARSHTARTFPPLLTCAPTHWPVPGSATSPRAAAWEDAVQCMSYVAWCMMQARADGLFDDHVVFSVNDGFGHTAAAVTRTYEWSASLSTQFP